MGREVGPKENTDQDQCWNSSTVWLSRNGIQDYRNKTKSEHARGRQREGRQVGEGQETGKQTDRQRLDKRRVVRQARGRQREGRQADEEQETGKQTGRQGLDDRWVVGSRQDQRSRVVQELRKSSVSTRDDLAETEWSERI